MKKKVQTFLIVTMILVGVVSLTGCGKKKENGIVGKWALGKFVYTFNKDKTCQYDASGTIMKCTYEIDGDKISILYDGNTLPFETTFSIDGDTLNVKDSLGNDTLYKRQK
ncbi:MAG: hypothetical protein IKE70_01190 [Bacilli bacterium]|nr:hypothetical protein [Bacilli bacterium]